MSRVRARRRSVLQSVSSGIQHHFLTLLTPPRLARATKFTSPLAPSSLSLPSTSSPRYAIPALDHLAGSTTPFRASYYFHLRCTAGGLLEESIGRSVLSLRYDDAGLLDAALPARSSASHPAVDNRRADAYHHLAAARCLVR